MALPKTLGKSEKRRIKAEFRMAFLLVTFLWPSKEKLLGCRAETRRPNTRRDSDTHYSKKAKAFETSFPSSSLGTSVTRKIAQQNTNKKN